MDFEQYDSAFLGILQHQGKIAGFLDAVFGFLFRKTDFFHPLSEDGKMGFLDGKAKAITIEAFNKYMNLSKTKLSSAKKKHHCDSVKTKNLTQAKKSTSSSPSDSKTSNREVKKSEEINNSVSKPEELKDNVEKLNSDEKPVYSAPPDQYNGAKCEHYSWSQSIHDIDMLIPVSSEIKKGRQVTVIVSKSHLKVIIPSNENTDKVEIDDDFPYPVKADDSMWTLDPGQNIQIHLDKITDRWWDRALKNEANPIDVQKIDASMPMSDLDEAAQAKISQVMYDQRQKQKGLPTSEEQKNLEILKKAWDADGSPFKGQPFDPSVLSNNSGNAFGGGDISKMDASGHFPPRC